MSRVVPTETESSGRVVPVPDTPAAPVGGGIESLNFAGSNGALSNGVVSIGGVDWTVYGVGTSVEVGIRAALSDLVTAYGPEGVLQAVAALSAYVSSSVQTGIQLGVRDSTLTYFDRAYVYRDGTGRWTQAASDVTGTQVQQQLSGGAPAEAGGRVGLVAARGNAIATADSTIDATAAYPMSLAAGSHSGASTDRVRNSAEVFGAGDIIQFGFLKYTAGDLTATITQNAGGLDFVLGAASMTLTDLHLQ